MCSVDRSVLIETHTHMQPLYKGFVHRMCRDPKRGNSCPSACCFVSFSASAFSVCCLLFFSARVSASALAALSAFGLQYTTLALPFRLSVSLRLSICLSACLYVFYICLSGFFFLSYLLHILSVLHSYFCPSVLLSVCIFLSLPCLSSSLHLSFCLPVCLSVFQAVASWLSLTFMLLYLGP